MAKKQVKSQEDVYKTLTPESMVVKVDGKEVRLAMSREENAILNMLLAAQLRALIQNTIKKYEDEGVVPSPKDLRDLAGAVRDANESSNAIFDNIEMPTARPSKRAEEPIHDTDFSKLAEAAPPAGEPAPEPQPEAEPRIRKISPDEI